LGVQEENCGVQEEAPNYFGLDMEMHAEYPMEAKCDLKGPCIFKIQNRLF